MYKYCFLKTHLYLTLKQYTYPTVLKICPIQMTRKCNMVHMVELQETFKFLLINTFFLQILVGL